MDVSAFQAGATDDLNLQQIMADRLRSLPKPIRTTVTVTTTAGGHVVKLFVLVFALAGCAVAYALALACVFLIWLMAKLLLITAAVFETCYGEESPFRSGADGLQPLPEAGATEPSLNVVAVDSQQIDQVPVLEPYADQASQAELHYQGDQHDEPAAIAFGDTENTLSPKALLYDDELNRYIEERGIELGADWAVGEQEQEVQQSATEDESNDLLSETYVDDAVFPKVDVGPTQSAVDPPHVNARSKTRKVPVASHQLSMEEQRVNAQASWLTKAQKGVPTAPRPNSPISGMPPARPKEQVRPTINTGPSLRGTPEALAEVRKFNSGMRKIDTTGKGRAAPSSSASSKPSQAQVGSATQSQRQRNENVIAAQVARKRREQVTKQPRQPSIDSSNDTPSRYAAVSFSPKSGLAEGQLPPHMRKAQEARGRSQRAREMKESSEVVTAVDGKKEKPGSALPEAAEKDSHILPPDATPLTPQTAHAEYPVQAPNEPSRGDTESDSLLPEAHPPRTPKRVMSIDTLKSYDTVSVPLSSLREGEGFDCQLCQRWIAPSASSSQDNAWLCSNCRVVDGRIDRAKAVIDDIEPEYPRPRSQKLTQNTTKRPDTGIARPASDTSAAYDSTIVREHAQAKQVSNGTAVQPSVSSATDALPKEVSNDTTVQPSISSVPDAHAAHAATPSPHVGDTASYQHADLLDAESRPSSSVAWKWKGRPAPVSAPTSKRNSSLVPTAKPFFAPSTLQSRASSEATIHQPLVSENHELPRLHPTVATNQGQAIGHPNGHSIRGYEGFQDGSLQGHLNGPQQYQRSQHYPTNLNENGQSLPAWLPDRWRLNLAVPGNPKYPAHFHPAFIPLSSRAIPVDLPSSRTAALNVAAHFTNTLLPLRLANPSGVTSAQREPGTVQDIGSKEELPTLAPAPAADANHKASTFLSEQSSWPPDRPMPAISNPFAPEATFVSSTPRAPPGLGEAKSDRQEEFDALVQEGFRDARTELLPAEAPTLSIPISSGSTAGGDVGQQVGEVPSRNSTLTDEHKSVRRLAAPPTTRDQSSSQTTARTDEHERSGAQEKPPAGSFADKKIPSEQRPVQSLDQSAHTEPKSTKKQRKSKRKTLREALLAAWFERETARRRALGSFSIEGMNDLKRFTKAYNEAREELANAMPEGTLAAEDYLLFPVLQNSSLSAPKHRPSKTGEVHDNRTCTTMDVSTQADKTPSPSAKNVTPSDQHEDANAAACDIVIRPSTSEVDQELQELRRKALQALDNYRERVASFKHPRSQGRASVSQLRADGQAKMERARNWYRRKREEYAEKCPEDPMLETQLPLHV